MALGRLRAALDADIKRPLLFLSQSTNVYTGLYNHAGLFPNPNPALPLFLTQIQTATSAQQLLATVKGTGARDAAFRVVHTSLKSQLCMVNGLCDASPEQAATLINASAMKAVSPRTYQKELLSLANSVTSGTVLLDANVSLLDSTSRRKTINWESTLDGKNFSAMPSTPTGKTSLANLTPLTLVGFRVSVTVNKQPQGPWSQVVTILVR